MKWPRFICALAVLWVVAAEPAPPQSPSTLSTPGSPSSPERPARWEQPDNPRVKTSLLVQVAVQQGREFIAARDYAGAIRILEAHLAKINGDAAYLQLLEQAYRGYVKQLQQKGDHVLAQRYLQKLAIFDPGVAVSESVKQAPEARSPDSSLPDSELQTPDSRLVLEQAEAAFRAHRFREAAELYQRASALGELSAELRDHWAYCRLHWVTEQINARPDTGVNWSALEREVRTALSLAAPKTQGQASPIHDCGRVLLENIESRTQIAQRIAEPSSQPRIAVQHHSQPANGWQVAESANFRVLHGDRALAEKAAQVAEQTRAAVLLKWFGERGPPSWSCKCDIYLHATAEAYARATGAPADSPGHSSIGAERHDASRITSLRIDLHADHPNLLTAVLPHETTHVALAGRFGSRPLPRWADEGMAVLSEPYDKVNRHLRTLPQAYQDGRAFSAGQLMKQEDYPGNGMLTAFYGQSVALVNYLTELKGARVFTEFLQAAQREGYEAALRRHYGFRDFNELEQQWRPLAAAGKEIGPGALARRRD